MGCQRHLWQVQHDGHVKSLIFCHLLRNSLTPAHLNGPRPGVLGWSPNLVALAPFPEIEIWIPHRAEKCYLINFRCGQNISQTKNMSGFHYNLVLQTC